MYSRIVDWRGRLVRLLVVVVKGSQANDGSSDGRKRFCEVPTAECKTVSEEQRVPARVPVHDGVHALRLRFGIIFVASCLFKFD